MRTISKSLILAGFTTLSMLAVSGTASAAEAAPAYTLTSNVSLVSDYYFRGLTQTWHKPALQGGVDYAHSSGFYAGLWASNVSGNQYSGGSLEVDYYGGYNGKINDDFSWTAGLYGYYYPGANVNKSAGPNASTADVKFNNLEWNVGVSYKWLSAKYSQSFTDYFGLNTNTGYTSDTKGSSYIDLSASIPLMDDLSLGLHVGHTDIKSKTAAGGNPDYNDYKIGVTKTFKDGWNIGVAYAKSSNSSFYDNTGSLANSDTSNLGDGRFILNAGRSF
ncbi:TorF family putative porin [Sulfurirhabdus autotrophica]|uniref:Uncharacterized protein (TIGR02001 family) n=1 Tax=Sulfurirhabdus autotrophica TaxID=1706046 RepID=A0A4R3Y8J8_9PROT|nr:TorF family putative porin [Sulfurirhabdus autotrophica]TCV88206.1 uncharacterized protein (TIGR02001 family) [Sulfurirhabdus autotrophica]